MGCLCEQSAGKGIEISPTCIGHLWVFADLQPVEMEAVATSALRKSFSRSEAVFMQGEPCAAVSLIKAGRVKLSKNTLREAGKNIQQGRELTLPLETEEWR